MSHPATACTKCSIEGRPLTVGVDVVILFSTPPRPQELWAADEFGCPNCGARWLHGWSTHPLAQHFEPDFHRRLAEAVRRDRVRLLFERVKDAEAVAVPALFLAEFIPPEILAEFTGRRR